MIRIRSLREGFRRAGVAHSVEVTEYPDDRFTADELEQLVFEPLLAVEVLPNDASNLARQDIRQEITDRLDEVGNDEAKDTDSSVLATEDADKAEPDAKTDKPAKKPAK